MSHPLKLDIIIVVILGVIWVGLPMIRGDYSGAGGAFLQWFIISAILMGVALWNKYEDIK
jgi:hypothetical protein